MQVYVADLVKKVEAAKAAYLKQNTETDAQYEARQRRIERSMLRLARQRKRDNVQYARERLAQAQADLARAQAYVVEQPEVSNWDMRRLTPDSRYLTQYDADLELLAMSASDKVSVTHTNRYSRYI